MVDASLVYFAKTHGNLHAAYSAAKAFSGPVATVIAAAVAARVTAKFAFLQNETARQQAAIARDQLNFNLFEKRYKVYDQVYDLLCLLINCLVAEHCWDPVGLAFADYAYRFQRLRVAPQQE